MMQRDCSFRNPVLSEGQDPWVIRHEGLYYLVQSRQEHTASLVLYVSSSLTGLGSEPPITIWDAPTSGDRSRDLWAPELHWLDGHWYIYYAACDGENRNHRMFVLESVGTSPLGPYHDRGKIVDPASDKWAIDGTVLEHGGRRYFIWSGWAGDEGDFPQNLYVARMESPWTLGPRVLLSEPELPWERSVAAINEGPQILKHGDQIFIIYSADASWSPEYKLGQLTLQQDNVLDRAAWRKEPQPVFATDHTQVYGPGHCSFVRSPDETEDWIVYHAKKGAEPGWDREIRMQPYRWHTNSSPDFGKPIPGDVNIPRPSGECDPTS